MYPRLAVYLLLLGLVSMSTAHASPSVVVVSSSVKIATSNGNLVTSNVQTYHSYTLFAASGLVRFNLSAVTPQAYLYSVVSTSSLIVQWTNSPSNNPFNILTKGTASYDSADNIETITFPGAMADPTLCIDFIGGQCASSSGGGGGGGGTVSIPPVQPALCISCLVTASGIPWLIAVLTLISIPLIGLGVYRERRKPQA